VSSKTTAEKAAARQAREAAIDAAQRAQRRRQVTAVVLAAVTVVGAVAALAFWPSRTDDATARGYSTQQTGFDLPALTGPEHVRLADHRGHPVVVNFFASWCVYCNQELPGFVQVARATKGTVDFVAVQTQDAGDVAGMAQRFDLSGAGFALARDVGGNPPSQLWASFGAQGLPVTAFYDATGGLVDFSGGLLSQTELQSRLTKNFGVTVAAPDAATLQAPVIPLIPQGAAELMSNGVQGSRVAVIDARTPAEYAAGHLQGAANIDSAAGNLDTLLAALPKDLPYIVYCHTGRRSAVLTAHLHDLGFKHVYDLQGGLAAWTQAALPTTR